MNKAFIITVDTEGDNLWDYHKGDSIRTENANYIPRFQSLCETFGFKPVYLTNYEMVLCDKFVESAKGWLTQDLCEVGVHLHAWNNPPEYKLVGPHDYNPYLIEYPEEIMRKKFAEIYNLIKERFGISPVSHRAGRWAMDERYFKILNEFGIKVDCSHTPHINWSRNVGITRGGSNYSTIEEKPSYINDVLEVPVSIRIIHHCSEGAIKHRIRTLIKGENVWPRPATQSASMIKRLIKKLHSDLSCDYVQFMIHSSELMPGGSPYFKTKEDINKLFLSLEDVFRSAKSLGYIGLTLSEYFNQHKNG